MFPRNAASPERIAIGAVVQISDGAVQTAGVSIKVKPQGAAASAGGGTTSYEDGIVGYLPTQAETDYTSFQVIAYKTGCIPAAVTIVTSASATAGYGGVDWSKVTAPTTTLALTGTTIAATQKVDVETIKTQAVTAAAGVTFPGSIASPTNITAGTITTVTNLTNAATAGDLTATMKASVTAAVPTSATIAGAVWDITLASHLTAGTTGFALNAAGSAGDPWGTALPGAYGAGSAGYIIGTNIDALISSRMATFTQPTGFLAATFPGTVASTTNITAATGVVLSGVTHTGAVIPTVTTLTGHTAQTGDSYARLGAPVGASISADIAGISAGSGLDAAGVRAAVGLASANLDTQLGAIVTDTAEIGAAGAGMTALATAANLATLTAYVDTEVAAILAAVDTEVAAIKAKTDNLPAAPAAVGDIPTAAAVAAATWDEALSGHTTSGTGGAALRDADLRGSRTVVRGTVGTSTTPSTTQFTPSALSPSGVAADQFKGRIIVWDNDTTTTALRGQATDITASTGATLPLLTFTALTTAPASGDTFSIV